MALIDSTGISKCWSANYIDTDRGATVVRDHNTWFEAHAGCGGVTGVVSGVIVSAYKRGVSQNDEVERTADVNFWGPLVRMAASVWDLKYALGDKAYLSDKNLEIALKLGIQAIIPIKAKWDIATKNSPAAKWLFEIYTTNIAFFENIYRYRSKVEGVFSAVKRTCGHYLWARGVALPKDREPTRDEIPRARLSYETEIVAKFLVLNLRTLVMLEELHGEKVNFAAHRAFQPIPKEYCVTDEPVDLADQATAVGDDEINEDDIEA